MRTGGHSEFYSNRTHMCSLFPECILAVQMISNSDQSQKCRETKTGNSLNCWYAQTAMACARSFGHTPLPKAWVRTRRRRKMYHAHVVYHLDALHSINSVTIRRRELNEPAHESQPQATRMQCHCAHLHTQTDRANEISLYREMMENTSHGGVASIDRTLLAFFACIPQKKILFARWDRNATTHR